MDERLLTRLRERLTELVFVELKKDIAVPGGDAVLKKGIPLPLPVENLADRVRGRNPEDLSVLEMVEGMARVLVLDPEFKHAAGYRRLLKTLSASMDRILVEKAIDLARRERLEEAFIEFEAALLLFPDNLDAAFNQAKVCEALSREESDRQLAEAWEEEALVRLERLSAGHEAFLPAYYHLGFHYANRNLYKKAEMVWERFLRESDDENKIMEVQGLLLKLRPRILFEEGYSAVLSGRFREGLEILLPLESEQEDWWNLHFFIGLAWRNLGDMEKAIEGFKRVVRIKPGQTDALNELGLCHSVLGDASEAARYFKKALNLDPENPEILCNLAMAQLSLGKVDLAETYLNQSVELAPEDPVTQACLVELKKFKNN